MLNKVQVIGRVGKDPEVRELGNDSKVASLRVAVSDKFTDKRTGEKKEMTEWVPVSVFGPAAGFVESYVGKGDLVYVEGKFQTRKWTDRDGNDRYMTEVVVQGFGGTLQKLSWDDKKGGRGDDRDEREERRPAARKPAKAAAPKPEKAAPYDLEDDEIPF